jgi:hypothetical protein
MLCKNEDRDPAHCLKEGRKVTRCAQEIVGKIRESCLAEFDAHWKCLENNNQVRVVSGARAGTGYWGGREWAGWGWPSSRAHPGGAGGTRVNPAWKGRRGAGRAQEHTIGLDVSGGLASAIAELDYHNQGVETAAYVGAPESRGCSPTARGLSPSWARHWLAVTPRPPHVRRLSPHPYPQTPRVSLLH